MSVLQTSLSLFFQIHVVTDQEEQEGVYSLRQVCRLGKLTYFETTISAFLTSVASIFLIILSGVAADAGQHREVSGKHHGDLVPGEAGQRRTGRVSLQSRQPQIKSARLLPPPAGFSP